jgi:hypothetical protein
VRSESNSLISVVRLRTNFTRRLRSEEENRKRRVQDRMKVAAASRGTTLEGYGGPAVAEQNAELSYDGRAGGP